MVRKPLIRILSAFLFVVFLVGVLPPEYIHHAIYDHEDDVHPLYGKGELVITKKHNHCSFLSFEYAPFLAPSHVVFVAKERAVYTGYIQSVYTFRFQTPERVSSTRGPPVA